MKRDWEMLPKEDFSERKHWRSLGNDLYAALRVRLLVVRSDGTESRFGPKVEAYNIPPDGAIEKHFKRETVISHTTTITEAIKFATSTRVCDQLAAKMSAELGAKVPGFSGKLNSELLAKSEYEITTTTESALSSTTSHVVQETTAEEHIIKLENKGSTITRVAELRRRYWPRRWDVYLHSYDYLELQYKRSWFWPDVRNTIKRSSDVLGWPLVSISFYEPQANIDVCYDPVTDELSNPEGIEIVTLTASMPRATAPLSKGLEDLAKQAFPVTRQEKAAVKKAAPRKAKKAAAKKAAPKKAAVKKASPKKAAPKKAAAKKTAMKKKR